jgi:tRNA-dihydrouridine synthase
MVLGCKQDDSKEAIVEHASKLVDEFRNMFPVIINGIIEDSVFADAKLTQNWVREVLQYNVPHGKLARYEFVQQHPTA